MCNLKCRYCYEGNDKSSCSMDKTTADNAITVIKKLISEGNRNALWINFHGGEPMLNFDIIKYIVDSIKMTMPDIKLYTSMTTNCTVYSKEIIDYINEITVSIDGTRDVHDRNRIRTDGSGTYDTAINNALLIMKQKKDVRLRMVICPNNVNDLYDSIVHLISLGFNEIIPGIDYFDKAWNYEMFDNIYEQLKKVIVYRKSTGRTDVSIGIIDTPVTRKGKCYVGCDGYQIAYDGLIYPCTYVTGNKEFVIGDVINGIDQYAVEKINCLCSRKVDECQNCSNYENCDSPRCLMLNKMITGDFYTPSAVVCASENLKLKINGMI